ncbi:MAG TPA: CRTAC1 family protein, partial [Bacteroidetes bacterium]|nr:CRTAC1 family protein [Bacteroidota bacterium]
MVKHFFPVPFLFFIAWPGWLRTQVAFDEIAEEAGLQLMGKNYGMAIADFDLDGDDDIYAISHGQPCRLFRNNGDGTFTDVATAAGVGYNGTPNTAGWLDADNDGDLDLFVANRDENNVFFLNNGDGTFSDHTFLSGLTAGGRVRALLFSDVNLDGLIDIYLARLLNENILYLNIGNNQFVNFTNASGAVDDQISMGAIFFDYDNDGDPDLYLTHDANQPNILYQNNGDGYFTDVSEVAGADIATNGMGVAAADINNDGYLDVYVTNLGANSLLLNNGDGTFSEMATAAGVDDAGMGWGCVFLDADNDGWQDLYAVNDSYFAPFPNAFYHNDHNGGFTRVSGGSVPESLQPGYGVATADFNLDGLMDMYLANYIGEIGNQLFENTSPAPHHRVQIKLEGSQSNRRAVGARLTLEAGGLVLVRELYGSGGYASQNSYTLHFGLGTATIIDQLTIRWPNGGVEVFSGLSV